MQAITLLLDPPTPLSPEAFVDELQAFAASSRAANHPLLLALAAGEVVDLQGAIRTFLREYYVYSRSFTRHLSAVSATLEDPAHRAALVPNAAEESGAVDEGQREMLVDAGLREEDVNAPHPELFVRFLMAIGIDRSALAGAVPDVATTAWIEMFHAACREDQEQALGALGVATEGIVRGMYGHLLVAIRRAWPSLTARDTAFFALHAAIDDEHARVLRGIAVDLAVTPGARRRMAIGVLKALQARSSFFDQMLAVIRELDVARDRRRSVAA